MKSRLQNTYVYAIIKVMLKDNKLITIGRVEQVVMPEIGVPLSHARIDTGAQTSAIWASSVLLKGNRLEVQFFGSGNPLFTGKTYIFDVFTETVVASSNGQTAHRYKVKLLVCIGGKKIRARFTLADRSSQVYPILIGRNLLKGKFVVDVNLGTPLTEEETSHSKVLQAGLKQGDQ
jgi:hypothetical protein